MIRRFKESEKARRNAILGRKNRRFYEDEDIDVEADVTESMDDANEVVESLHDTVVNLVKSAIEAGEVTAEEIVEIVQEDAETEEDELIDEDEDEELVETRQIRAQRVAEARARIRARMLRESANRKALVNRKPLSRINHRTIRK